MPHKRKEGGYMPKESGSDRLTENQENYVLELIKGKSQREAYRIAYPNCKAADNIVDVKASNLLNLDKVRVRFEELQGRIRKKAEKGAVATAEEVLEELTNIALGRKEYPTHDMFGNEFKKKTTVNERLKALELLGKHHKAFTDNVNLNHQGAIQIVDDIE